MQQLTRVDFDFDTIYPPIAYYDAFPENENNIRINKEIFRLIRDNHIYTPFVFQKDYKIDITLLYHHFFSDEIHKCLDSHFGHIYEVGYVYLRADIKTKEQYYYLILH